VTIPWIRCRPGRSAVRDGRFIPGTAVTRDVLSRRRFRALLGFALLGVIVVAAVAVGPERAVDTLLELRDSPWLLPLFLALYLLRPFVAWPHSPFPVAAGFYFGVAGGTLVALAGLLLTTLPPFAVGRYLKSDAGAFGRASELADRFRAATGGFRAVAGARLLPVPADLVSYGAGVAGVRTRTFVLGTVVGDLPWLIGLVFVGSQLEKLTVEGIEGLDPTVVVLLALIGLVLLAKPLYARLRE
jgi:uncharacterized membrane protein YdjX (TVP38/TMEM64 family)